VEDLWRCREQQVAPLQQPAKRQRRFKKTDTSFLEEVLRSPALHGTLSYLRGGPLDTLAAKVTRELK
jgi:hypothetical protein